ncbi:hypothetical protein [Streptosporangium saharense]|uniref:Uncharacterized protein n=1 Tax=Streptosporangium saharense TaxID=1706840 RepID=A0A7W7QT09_9ACTN|nr:hypothetical protein [Streptosporangium saharense]MBB4919265.1 hypothetical protein [Streptosporangium saharense]
MGETARGWAMPGKRRVLRLLAQGESYEKISRVLGIPPGRAYLIATGVPADGGDTVTHEQRRRPGMLPSHTQLLVNPREFNPTAHDAVHRWINRRVQADAPMRAAEAERTR